MRRRLGGRLIIITIPMRVENGWYGKEKTSKSVGVGEEKEALPKMGTLRTETRDVGDVRLFWGAEVDMSPERETFRRDVEEGIQESSNLMGDE